VRTAVPGPCPVCNADIEYLYQTENIPYFKGILIISACCPACGWRFAETQLLENAEPSRWELRVESADDLNIRVVRSTTGIIRIPELGVRVDPGPACEGFVSNVEGVICRVEAVVDNLISWNEHDPEEREKALAIKKKLEMVREGTLPVTLIIDDLTGNSAILADKAKVTPIEIVEECESEE
jgi:zinc finger protein